jgi:hypothetical protein
MKPSFKLPLTGRCQCKGVVYKITSAPLAVYACHCTECQRQSGSAFSLSLLAERSAVVVEGGVGTAAREWAGYRLPDMFKLRHKTFP